MMREFQYSFILACGYDVVFESDHSHDPFESLREAYVYANTVMSMKANRAISRLVPWEDFGFHVSPKWEYRITELSKTKLVMRWPIELVHKQFIGYALDGTDEEQLLRQAMKRFEEKAMTKVLPGILEIAKTSGMGVWIFPTDINPYVLSVSSPERRKEKCQKELPF